MVTITAKVMMAVIKLEARTVCSVVICFQELNPRRTTEMERLGWQGRKDAVPQWGNAMAASKSKCDGQERK